MTELISVQTCNQEPISQIAHKLEPGASQSRLYLVQLLETAINSAMIREAETNLTEEQLEILHQTFAREGNSPILYRRMTEVMGESNLLHEKENLLEKLQEIDKTEDYENSLKPLMELLEMIAGNLDSNGDDLEPSLHNQD
jgi:Ca2+-binding EF-hand superfamily protein